MTPSYAQVRSGAIRSKESDRPRIAKLGAPRGAGTYVLSLSSHLAWDIHGKPWADSYEQNRIGAGQRDYERLSWHGL